MGTSHEDESPMVGATGDGIEIEVRVEKGINIPLSGLTAQTSIHEVLNKVEKKLKKKHGLQIERAHMKLLHMDYLLDEKKLLRDGLICTDRSFWLVNVPPPPPLHLGLQVGICIMVGSIVLMLLMRCYGISSGIPRKFFQEKLMANGGHRRSV